MKELTFDERMEKLRQEMQEAMKIWSDAHEEFMAVGASFIKSEGE